MLSLKQHRTPTERIALYAILMLGALAASAWALLADPHTLVVHLPDDVFYYFKIAENVANGLGSTFDGINPTNGFQPLWLVLSTAIFELPFDPDTNARLVLILNVLLLVLAVVLVERALRRELGPSTAVTGAALMAVVAFRFGLNGMETACVFASLAALLVYVTHSGVVDKTTPSSSLMCGVLLGIAMLSRLDLAAVALVIGFACVWRCVSSRTDFVSRTQQLIAIPIGAALVLVPYMIYNLVAFGAVMPISGRLKAQYSWDGIISPAFLLPLFKQTILVASLALAVGFLIYWVATARQTSPSRLRTATGLLTIAVLGHYVHEAAFIRWGSMPWHFALEWFLPPIVLPLAIDRVSFLRSSRRLPAVVLVIAALVLAMSERQRWRTDNGANWHAVAYDAAMWVDKNLPTGAVLAMKDSGIVGFFSRRPLINLDGVVNNMNLQSAMRDGALRAYLARNRVTYLVQHALVPDDPYLQIMNNVQAQDIVTGRYENVSFRYRSQAFHVMSDNVNIKSSDEAYRSPEFSDDGRDTRLLIWRLEP